MQIAEFKFTRHALKRAVDMAIGNSLETAEALRRCLEEPVNTYEQGNGAIVYQSDRISAVTHGRFVVTVVWNLKERWSRADISISAA